MRSFLCATLLLLACQLNAQSSSFGDVYQIFQSRCISCHSHSAPEAGLDLEGGGGSLQVKMSAVFFNIFRKTPGNTTAQAKGMKYIYPGRVDKSFLFHKINKGLEPTMVINQSTEGESMPPYGQTELTDAEKESIRQWILFGAKQSGVLFDRTLVENFYSRGGLESFPDGPPQPPSSNEGFQIKMGPFFLQAQGNPGSELEFFTKYELNLPSGLEVKELDIIFSGSSHHFIIYSFGNQNGTGIPDGFRVEADHSDVSLVAAVQEPTHLKLPGGTAFSWRRNLVLDLNSHYINYSASNEYKAETYVNVYTQPKGTALQEMETALIVNGDIPIPNNGEVITHKHVVNNNAGKFYLWGAMGHTHKYGRDYKAYEREGAQRGALIYDASCPRGIPGCSSPYFDYRHIPMRYFEPLFGVDMSFLKGIEHEAKWVNNGPNQVNFGPTSQDEMMVMVLMYTRDTTGIVYSSAAEPTKPLDGIEIFPNPAETEFRIVFPVADTYSIELLNIQGNLMKEISGRFEKLVRIQANDLVPGLYFVRIRDGAGRTNMQKVLIAN